GEGVLRLNSGKFASDRLYNNILDGDEEFTVTQTGVGSYHVTSPGGGSHDYDNVTKIEAFGGQGKDKFTFIGVTIPVEVDGDQGDDLIDFSQSSGPLTANGGLGNDTLLGGGGNDLIHGDEGADII